MLAMGLLDHHHNRKENPVNTRIKLTFPYQARINGSREPVVWVESLPCAPTFDAWHKLCYATAVAACEKHCARFVRWNYNADDVTLTVETE